MFNSFQFANKKMMVRRENSAAVSVLAASMHAKSHSIVGGGTVYIGGLGG